MQVTITENIFKELFRLYDCGRKFSDEGLSSLFEFLVEARDKGFGFDVKRLSEEFIEGDYQTISELYDFDLSSTDVVDRFEAMIQYLEWRAACISYNSDTGWILAKLPRRTPEQRVTP